MSRAAARRPVPGVALVAERCDGGHSAHTPICLPLPASGHSGEHPLRSLAAIVLGDPRAGYDARAAMYRALSGLTFLSAVVIAAATSLALTLPAGAVTESELSKVEDEINEAMSREIEIRKGSMRSTTTGKYYSYDERRRHKAISFCINWNANHVDGFYVRIWGWSSGQRNLYQAKENAIFYCESYKSKQSYGSNCDCSVVLINDEMLVDIPESILTDIAEKRRQQQKQKIAFKEKESKRREAELQTISRMTVKQAREQATIWRKELEEIDRTIVEANAEIKQKQKDQYSNLNISGLRAQIEAIHELRSELKAKFEAATARAKALTVAKETTKDSRVAAAQVREQSATSDDSAEEQKPKTSEKIREHETDLARERQKAERPRRVRDEARREKARAEAERKAAAEYARKLAEEQRRAEEQQRAEARRQAEQEAARKLAKERAREEQLAAQQQNDADQQFAALVKRLQESNLLAQPRDIDLPVIRARVPGRVEVGDRVRITGLVGDGGSPPRLKVNGEPTVLFRLEAGQKPIAKHTLAFGIDVDTTDVGTRIYVLEACDANQNCVGERLALSVVPANRPKITARNYALIIGNNDYQNLPDLQTAVADARSIAGVLADRYAFEPANISLLLNASRTAILDQLETIRQQIGPDDRLLLYYAGHGEIDPITESGYWQPVDALPGKRYSWIANDDIRRELRGIPARHILVVADSCFSGSLARGPEQYEGVPKDRFYTVIDTAVSRKVISSGGTEPVADSGSGGHSVFAYYLLKALRENEEPYLVSFELFNKLVRAVTNNSNQKPQYGTIREAGDEGAGDFTFILRSDS